MRHRYQQQLLRTTHLIMISTPKKIAVCIGAARLGGSFNSTTLLALQLSKAGFDTTLIVTGNYEAPEIPSEAEHVIFPNSGVKSLSKRVANLFTEILNYDAILFTESLECVCVASGLPSHIPIVHIVRNTFGATVALRNSRYIDAYVAVSPVVKEFLNVHHCPVDPYVIGNCTTHAKIIPKDCPATRLSPIRIVYIGRLIQFHKNVMILPKIASILREHGMNCEWTIAGDGLQKDALLRAFTQVEVPVEFVKLSHRETADLLADSDYCIVPSKFEAFGLVLIESVACGCLPICSDAPAFHWILGEDSEHLQVDHGDDAEQYVSLIQKLEANPQLRLTVRNRLLQRQSTKFSPEVMSSSYSCLLSKLWSDPSMRGNRLKKGKFTIPFRKRYSSLVTLIKAFRKIRNRLTNK